MLSFGRALSEQGFSKLSVSAAAAVDDHASIDSRAKHMASFKSAHFFQPASKVHVLNVAPGADVIGCIQTYLFSNKIEAANIMSAVGTLRCVTMRLAYCDEGKGYPTRTHHGKKQKYQLISLSGCLSMHGARLSVCIGDSAGASHVGQLVGNMIAHDHVEICTLFWFILLCFYSKIIRRMGYAHVFYRHARNSWRSLRMASRRSSHSRNSIFSNCSSL